MSAASGNHGLIFFTVVTYCPH